MPNCNTVLPPDTYEEEDRSAALRVALQEFSLPKGWRSKTSMARTLYENLVTGEKVSITRGEV